MDKNPTQDALDTLIHLLVTQEKLDHGKRFSTYYEAYGRLVDVLSDLHANLAEFNQRLQKLWDMMRAVPGAYAPEEINSYIAACGASCGTTLIAAAFVQALLVKLQDGVVHPPKMHEIEKEEN